MKQALIAILVLAAVSANGQTNEWLSAWTNCIWTTKDVGIYEAISNLTVEVEVVTNETRVTGDCPGCADWGIRQGAQFFPGHLYSCPANRLASNECEVTTTVTERKTLRFYWDGEPAEVVRERVLSETVKQYRKEETWVEGVK